MNGPGHHGVAPDAKAVEEILGRVSGRAAGPSPAVRRLFGGRMNSAVFYVESSAFPTPAIVKIYLDPETRARRPDFAARQFDALTRASEAMQDGSSYRVPKPYLLLEAESLVAAEWVVGDTLADRLKSWRTSIRELEADMRRCGSWLAHFHRALRAGEGPLDSVERYPVLSEWEQSAVFGRGVPQRALRLLRERAQDAAGIPLPRSGLHGDYKADNVLLSREATTGIDIELRHENSIVYDLAAFLNQFECACYEPSGWRLYPVRRRLLQAFLEGYFEEGGASFDLPLSWTRLYMLTGRCADPDTGKLGRLKRAMTEAVMESVMRDLRMQ